LYCTAARLQYSGCIVLRYNTTQPNLTQTDKTKPNPN